MTANGDAEAASRAEDGELWLEDDVAVSAGPWSASRSWSGDGLGRGQSAVKAVQTPSSATRIGLSAVCQRESVLTSLLGSATMAPAMSTVEMCVISRCVAGYRCRSPQLAVNCSDDPRSMIHLHPRGRESC